MRGNGLSYRLLLGGVIFFLVVIGWAQEARKPVYHIVEQGNTLYGISVRYKVPIHVLREWNNLPNYSIKVGQQLIVGYQWEEPPAPVDTAPSTREMSLSSESHKFSNLPDLQEKNALTPNFENIGFNITSADTLSVQPDFLPLLPPRTDTLMNNLLFCGGVDDDRPVGISSVFYHHPRGKNYVYVFLENDTAFNIRHLHVELYAITDKGQKNILSSRTYEIKPRWKYAVFKHYMENPGLYQVAVYDINRRKLGDGTVRIVSEK